MKTARHVIDEGRPRAWDARRERNGKGEEKNLKVCSLGRHLDGATVRNALYRPPLIAIGEWAELEEKKKGDRFEKENEAEKKQGGRGGTG